MKQNTILCIKSIHSCFKTLLERVGVAGVFSSEVLLVVVTTKIKYTFLVLLLRIN